MVGMNTTAFSGKEVKLSGSLPQVGSVAPDFTLTAQDLSDINLRDFQGKNVVLNIFPSLDTEVCAFSVRKFNKSAAELADTVVLCISMDLPFAMGRFCAAEGIENVEMGSAFRSDFAQKYGVRQEDGPLRGLLARAVVIIDKDGKVKYTQLVPEITTEPDYEAALAAL